MREHELTAPVVLLIFNRPDTTARVFAEVAKARPKELYVIADGPRPDRPDDFGKCAQARAVVEDVDWDCQVSVNYADTNMGSGRRVASGLDWVFGHVEQAIILEDDCVPNQSFFPYCELLLERYRHASQIMMVSGNNFLFGRRRDEYSYYFSRYGHCWGWATWKRAWRHFDFSATLWPVVRDEGRLWDILGDRAAVNSWTRKFQQVYGGRDDIWDYQWILSYWLQGGLSISPSVNLVTNIGFGENATHTRYRTSIADVPTATMDFPLRHPPFIIRDAQADLFLERNRYGSGINKRFKRALAGPLRKLHFLR